MADHGFPPPLAGEGQGGGRQRVVIVGAGFGGLARARKLDGEPLDVVLLDQHNYHLFTPLLYQVATGLLNPSDIAYPLRTIFRHSPNVRFHQATVTRVDLASKLVRLDASPPLSYDYLVLATGSTDNYYGDQDVARVSLGLKSLEDATRLRNHVLTCLERADAEPDPEARRALLTFVVVGGGPTGVESSGALNELMEIVAGKDYHQISRAEIQVILVEGADRLLNAFSLRLGRYAPRTIADAVRGVQGERAPFHYVDKGTMATIGRNAGVTHLPGGLEFTGFLGWLTWIFVHIYYLIGFRNRISALSSWAWDYLRHDRPIRIILAAGSAPKRV